MHVKWMFAVMFVLLLIPVVNSQELKVAILVSDNEADMAVAATVESSLERKGMEVDIFVTPWGVYNSTIVDRIKAYSPSKIIIIGGKIAVVDKYEDSLSDYDIIRASGSDRYETAALAVNLLKNVFNVEVSNVVVLYGFDDYSLKEIVKKAEELNAVVILVKDNQIPPLAKEILRELKPGKVVIKRTPNMIKEIELEIKEVVKEVEVEEMPIKERASREIKEAEGKLNEAKEKFAEYTGVAKVAVERLIELSEKELYEARKAYENRNYGKAYGLAVSAKVHAKNAIKIMKEVQVEAFLGIYKDIGEMKSLMEKIKEMKTRTKEDIEKHRKEVPVQIK